ncbi:FAD-dependent oxidoreductase [Sphingorhabdus sp.]|uniref:dihydrolipoyl dehydrogenase family protein n=1 Tax=Sphingorhabdus sp. TaxID=1902408 RepID=UPI0032B82150
MPASWTKPRKFDRNLIVIGAGAAGLVSSYIAAMAKAKVTLIEAHDMGGDCLNTGCVPSKALLKSARVAHGARDAARYGIGTGEVKVDFPRVMQRIREVITAIEPHDSIERFTGLGVDCITGYARFVDPWTVDIAKADGSSQRLTAKAFVIATGAAPVVPPIPGVETSGYLTSETLWNEMATRKSAPARLAILGGGPIGCELAQAFQRLGSQVTLVEMADRLMLKEDAEAAALVTETLKQEGVDVCIGHKAIRFNAGKQLLVEAAAVQSAVAYDDLIIAVGRKARVTGFGLEELGLLVDGRLAVDAKLATALPHIFVAGDVAGNQQLTHGASHEAWYATVNALARPFKSYKADYRVLPRVTYTDPEVASVGLTELEAQAQSVAYDVTRYDLDDLDRAIAEGETHGFVKILTAPGKDRILGATIVASHAGEMIAELVFAMRYNLPLGKLMAVIHSYPTWSEANKFAAGQYRLARKPERLQRLAQRWFDWQRG